MIGRNYNRRIEEIFGKNGFEIWFQLWYDSSNLSRLQRGDSLRGKGTRSDLFSADTGIFSAEGMPGLPNDKFAPMEGAFSLPDRKERRFRRDFSIMGETENCAVIG